VKNGRVRLESDNAFATAEGWNQEPSYRRVNSAGLRGLAIVISKADLYRQNADECRALADRSRNPADKERWLKLAERWLQMAQEAEATAPGREGD
jgi:hypothetical protein